MASSAPSSSMPSASPPPPQQLLSPITEAMLKDARRQFLRHAREPRDGDLADGDVGINEGNEADDPTIQVVIARGVTREQYEAIDPSGLGGLVVELREDGALVLVEIVSMEECVAMGAISTTASAYASVNAARGLFFAVGSDLTTNPGGRGNQKPQGGVYAIANGQYSPLVIFLVGTGADGCSSLIRKAAHCFRSLPTLVRVIGVTFFRPRMSPTATHMGLLPVPALAMAFGRSNQDDRVCILVATLFGNAPLDGRILGMLRNPQQHDLPMDEFRVAARFNDTTFTGALHRDRVAEEVETWVQDYDSGDLVGPAPMVVPMPLELPPLVLPLFQIFVAAMRGWDIDTTAAA